MDLVLLARQMMAEMKFSDAEVALKNALISSVPNQRTEITSLYLDCLIQQKKYLPDDLVAESLVPVWNENSDLALQIFESASDQIRNSHDIRILSFKALLAEKRGKIQELYELISEFQVSRYERDIPFVPAFIRDLVQKYFKADFKLKLQELALMLLRRDYVEAEKNLRALIIEAFEKSSQRALKDKLSSILHVLQFQSEKGVLEIYQGLLHIYLNGFETKKDYKKLTEAVIYFSDFRFSMIILRILNSNNLINESNELATEIYGNIDYDYVFVAKYFPELKPYFVSIEVKKEKPIEVNSPDLTLTEDPSEVSILSTPIVHDEDERLLIYFIQNENHTEEALLDLSVSFLQSELPRIAAVAAMKAYGLAKDSRHRLKAAYLALSAYLQMGDYRKVVDMSLEAMSMVETTEDLLSFLYSQSEGYLRLGMKKEARSVLKRIVQVDSNYRLARERLEKLG